MSGIIVKFRADGLREGDRPQHQRKNDEAKCKDSLHVFRHGLI
jgi:hypothetical protein